MAKKKKKAKRPAAKKSSKKKDRKSTRLNSSHSQISYAVFCLKKKNKQSVHAPSFRYKQNNAPGEIVGAATPGLGGDVSIHAHAAIARRISILRVRPATRVAAP